MYVCPSANFSKHTRSSDPYLTMGYGMNIFVNEYRGFLKWSGYTYQAATMSQLKSSATMIFCSDSFVYKERWAIGITSLYHTCNTYWSEDTDSYKIRALRHNQGMNVTYCDGHAKFAKKGDAIFHGQGDSCGTWGEAYDEWNQVWK